MPAVDTGKKLVVRRQDEVHGRQLIGSPVAEFSVYLAVEKPSAQSEVIVVAEQRQHPLHVGGRVIVVIVEPHQDVSARQFHQRIELGSDRHPGARPVKVMNSGISVFLGRKGFVGLGTVVEDHQLQFAGARLGLEISDHLAQLRAALIGRTNYADARHRGENTADDVEPPGGIEPPTYSLRVNRSTD